MILVFKGHKAWPSGGHAITAVQYNVIEGYVYRRFILNVKNCPTSLEGYERRASISSTYSGIQMVKKFVCYFM
jgi:hypothetical protein